MKKIIVSLSILFWGISHASALGCIDLKSGLARGMEASNVLKLQTFLFEKGYFTYEPPRFAMKSICSVNPS